MNFNPRSPYGERLGLLGVFAQMERISIHAPLTGSDVAAVRGTSVEIISIHAPLTGSDSIRVHGRHTVRYFNPRSPYGERPGINVDFNGNRLFQSTLPLRGATV